MKDEFLQLVSRPYPSTFSFRTEKVDEWFCLQMRNMKTLGTILRRSVNFVHFSRFSFFSLCFCLTSVIMNTLIFSYKSLADIGAKWLVAFKMIA